MATQDTTQTTTDTSIAPGTSQANAANDTNALYKAISDKLINQSGVVSSQDTNLETEFNKAIDQIKTGQTASNTRIESQFGRAINEAKQTGLNTITNAQEEQRGFATVMPAMRIITQTVDKNINDLTQRKEEAILANNAQAANTISGLITQQLQFKIDSQQKAFTNLLAMGSFALQGKQQAQAEQAQSFQQQQQIASIGLQYGVPVTANDTIESIVAKATPLASQEQKARLGKLLADTRLAQAEVVKAEKGQSFVLDNTNVDTFASTLDNLSRSTNPDDKLKFQAIYQNVLDNSGSGAVVKIEDAIKKQRAAEFAPEVLKTDFQTLISQGKKGADLKLGVATLVAQNIMTNEQATKANKLIDEMTKNEQTPSGLSLSKIATGLAQTEINVAKGIYNFLTK